MAERDEASVETKTGIKLRRRDFLGSMLGAAAGLLIAACTPSASTPSPAGSAGGSAGVRKPTGTLTVATADIGNALYVPSRLDTPAGNTALASFGESLIERKADRSLGPRLARSWSVSPDGRTYTFDLSHPMTSRSR
jgi:peptide/nickel transport system substrate-binding protein